MAPTVVGDPYAKDLTKLPSLSGGFFVSNVAVFIIPDDVRVFCLTEKTYEKADFHHIADIEIMGFHSSELIKDEIERMRYEDASDEEIIDYLAGLDMFDEQSNVAVARFAYNNFDFVDMGGNPASGKQIKGAFVHPDESGVGLAAFVYRQLVLMYQHLICDNTQTEFGAALWAATMREEIGTVDIYDATRNKYVEELGEKGLGIRGCIPWDLNQGVTKLNLSRWKTYPFNVQSCYHLVLIISA